MAADQGLIDSVANSNTKTVAEVAAWAMGQSMLNYTAHQQRLNQLAEKFLATSIKSADEIDPEQAAATLKLLTGNDLGQALSSLGTAVAQIQQLMKGAQSTPPETATK